MDEGKSVVLISNLYDYWSFKLKIWVTAILLLMLSGCASAPTSTNYYRAINDCRLANPELGACAVEYAAYQKHLDALDRRALKRTPKCPTGTAWYCYRQSCGCARNENIRQVLRRYGID